MRHLARALCYVVAAPLLTHSPPKDLDREFVKKTWRVCGGWTSLVCVVESIFSCLRMTPVRSTWCCLAMEGNGVQVAQVVLLEIRRRGARFSILERRCCLECERSSTVAMPFLCVGVIKVARN